MTTFFMKKLVAGRVFSNFSDEVTEGGDEVRIPSVADNFSANDIDTTSGDITGESVSDTNTKLSINKWKGTALRFSDYQLAQVARNYNLRSRYAQVMAERIARQFDTDLINTAKQGGLDTNLGDSATQLTSTNLESAFSILESNSVPREELNLLLHPKMVYGDIFRRSKYYDASQFGSGMPVPSGSVDSLYGVPVFRTQNMGTSSGALANLLVHPEAVAYAIGNLEGASPSSVRIQEKTGESLRIKVISDLMYGSKTLRSEGGVLLLAKNDR